MTSSISSFFGATTGKGISFPNLGDSVTGTITAVHPPEPQTDIKTKEPIPGKEQVRIDLQTDLRDPGIEFDDGSRTLYVRGWMVGAIADAIRKAGVREPQVGGKLTVTFSHQDPPSRPGFDGLKKYTAEYVAGPVTGEFFKPDIPAPAGNGATPVRPAAISQAAWDQMDAVTKAAVSKTMSNEPPF